MAHIRATVIVEKHFNVILLAYCRVYFLRCSGDHRHRPIKTICDVGENTSLKAALPPALCQVMTASAPQKLLHLAEYRVKCLFACWRPGSGNFNHQLPVTSNLPSYTWCKPWVFVMRLILILSVKLSENGPIFSLTLTCDRMLLV